MDFSELLQLANSNKVSARKDYNKQQQARQDEQQRQERNEVHLKSRAAAHLKEVQAKADRERTKYKGLTSVPQTLPSSDSQPALQRHSGKPRPSSHTSKHEDKLTECSPSNRKVSRLCTSDSMNHTPAKSKSPLAGHISSKPTHCAISGKANVTASAAGSGAGKSKGSKHLAAQSTGAAAGGAVGGTGKSKATGSKTKALSRSASPIPGHRDGTPNKVSSKARPSTNFQDLMKMAQQNSSKEPAINKSRDVKTMGLPSSASPKGNSSVGKSLMDRVHQRAKGHHVPNSQQGKSLSNSSRQLPEIRGSRVSAEPSRGSGTEKPLSGRRTRSDHPPPTRSDLKMGGGVASPGKHEACLPGRNNAAHLNKNISRRGRVLLKGRGVPSGGGQAAGANSFYGTAATRILGKDGQRHTHTSGLGSYKSSWVDEMSEYMHSNDFAPGEYSDEGDDDLDGFLASDEEVEEGQDYSSEICKIFGYDRTKYRDDDDCAMESSYAQQEFEENRSARIGLVEDEHELARDQAGQARRKRRKVTGKPSLKKTKPHF